MRGLAIAAPEHEALAATKVVPNRGTEARPIHAHTFCCPATGKQQIADGDTGNCSRSSGAAEGRISLCCSLDRRFLQPLCGLDHLASDLPARVDLRSSGRYQELKAFFRNFDTSSRHFSEVPASSL